MSVELSVSISETCLEPLRPDWQTDGTFHTSNKFSQRLCKTSVCPQQIGAGVSGASTEVALSLISFVGRFSLPDVTDSVGLGVDTVRL